MFDLLSPILSFIGGERRNSAQADMADKQMQFQADQSTTAYQRAVKDMQLAGLNPMLAYSQGGASAGNGAMAQVEDTISPAVQTAFQRQRLTQELDNMKATEKQSETAAKVNEAQAKNIEADTINKDLQGPQIQASTRQQISSAGNLEATTKRIDSEIEKLKAEISNLPKVGKQIDATISNLIEQNRQISADIVYKKVLTSLTQANVKLTSAQTLQLKSTLGQIIELNNADIALRRAKIPGQENQANFDRTDAGKAMPYVEAAGTLGNSAKSVISPFKGKK
ncbi:MAG: DNA pilot protein [Microviridae sp.]|nr:MAG: DNA pilot protein [Microviridae sp.]